MTDLLKQAKQITEIVVKNVPEIDLVLLYGGIAQNRGHSRSDFDMIAISDSKKVVWEFVLNEQPISLWPMTWQQAEDIVKGEKGYWSVAASSLTHSKLLWVKSKKVNQRFENLKILLREGGTTALRKSIETFDALYGKLWHLQKSIEQNNNLDITFLVWDIANELVHILSALNNQPLLNNWGKQQQEISYTFEILPNDFIKRYEQFLKADPKEALKIGSALVDDVHLLIKDWLKKQERALYENVHGIASEWPSVIEYRNKSKSATEKDDVIAGLYAACDNAEFFLWAFTLLQGEKWERNSFYSANAAVINLSRDIPNNISRLLRSKNLIALQEATEQLVKTLEEELRIRGAKLPIATSLSDGIRFLQVEDVK